MSDVAISVENISKRYRIGTQGGPAYHRLSEMITGVPRALWNVGKSLVHQRSPAASTAPDLQNNGEFWALKDVSFEIKQGEVVGIIGRNGAGKSTLLKILSRITEPTSGRFGIRGRVASLLEVGTGFHPELTGRENIYVSGISLGMTRAEIKKRFDEIVDFSGVEKFLDSPVKNYSSGMQVRLGFAVAAHLESENLIVDEVLAVGDVEFQKKCVGKMNEAAQCGRTVLIVSHNLPAVRSQCRSLIWLNAGVVREIGPSSEIVTRYASDTQSIMNRRNWAQIAEAPGTENVRMVNAEVRASSTAQNAGFTISCPLKVSFTFRILTSGILWNPSILVQTPDGRTVFNTFPPATLNLFTRPLADGMYECAFDIPDRFLNDEAYCIHFYMIRDRSKCEFRVDDILSFELIDDLARPGWYGKWDGVVRPYLHWTAEQVN
jgi:lipopolysaccharide transport system ATP-binding protein